MSNIRVFFAGDFCSKPSTSFISVSDDLKELIQSCDLRVVNFEVPLKPDIILPPQQYERFWQNDDSPEFLKELGFNLFTIANNHIFDWGEEGLKKTKLSLGEASFGAGAYNDAYKTKICEISGVKIGFLALSYAAYTGVFDDVLRHDGLGCAYINDLRVNHDIMEAKKKVDYLFVLPHDGVEYIDIPLPETIARYRDFVDYGADGVFASHPHCPQGWEEYKGKPIFYSLGNFFFNSKDTAQFRADKPHWYEGLCVVLDLDGNNLKCNVFNTKNEDNTRLLLDSSETRNAHNESLCLYLTDKEKYSVYLDDVCARLAKSIEMPIVDHTFHSNTLKSSTKILLKKWVKTMKKEDVANDFSLTTLLRNDTRRSVLVRWIKE